MIEEIRKNTEEFEIVIVSPNEIKIDKIETLKLNLNLFEKLICYFRINNFLFQKILNKFITRNKFESFFKNNNIDLIFFLNASQYIQYIESLNFIVNIPDIAHRNNLEFPEIRKNSEFEIRERIYKNFLPKAFNVITNSKIIKKDLIRYYNLSENRVSVISHQPSDQIVEFKYDIEMENQIRKKYVLPKNFIFYPAQFWAHKNHRLIIDSFKILKEKKTIMRCMFISAEQIKVIKIF